MVRTFTEATLLNSVHPVDSCGRGWSPTFQSSLVVCHPRQKVTSGVNFAMTAWNLTSNILWWRQKIMSPKSVHGDEPSLATQPKPWDTQCKPLSAVKIIFPFTLLQFSSGWRSSEEVFFPHEKARLTSASPSPRRESEGRSTTSTFPSWSASSPSLMGSQSQGHRQPQNVFSSGNLHQPHIHITPAGKPTKGPKSWRSLIITHPCIFLLPLGPCIGSPHGLGLHRQRWVWAKLGLLSPGDGTFPPSPASTNIFSTGLSAPSPGAGSWSSEASQR